MCGGGGGGRNGFGGDGEAAKVGGGLGMCQLPWRPSTADPGHGEAFEADGVAFGVGEVMGEAVKVMAGY
jgi:hypothetical protein